MANRDTDGLITERMAGRLTGKRAIETRDRILSCVSDMLTSTSFRDLKVTDVARSLNMSQGAFYHYFPDIETAVLELAKQLGNEGSQLRELVRSRDWHDNGGRDAAGELVDGFLKFWRDHRSLLRVMDLAALEGDSRFSDVRVKMLNAVTVELADIISSLRDADQPDDGSPLALAGALVGMLAHNSAHQAGFRKWKIERVDLRLALIELVALGVTSSSVMMRET